MTTRKGSGAASKEVSARLVEVLLGGNVRQVSPPSYNPQVTNTRSRADFAAQIARDLGPRLASQSWQRLAQGGAK